MGDEEYYSETQRNQIYTKYLLPLKLKISQILLYDTEAALKFLQEYNEIIKREKELGIKQIIDIINDLEIKIGTYEKKQGKEKMYDEQSNTLIQQIDDLQIHYKQLTLEDFEQQMKEINNVYYSNSTNYTFEKREAIEAKINSLQANLIMQKANIGITEEINEMISENNKEGLKMYIYSELSSIMQSSNATVQRIANQLKTTVANGDEFLYNPKTWILLDSAQRNILETSEKQGENIINLPAVQDKKAPLSFLDRFIGTKIKVGDKVMKVKKRIQLGTEEIRTKDLSKIDMNWLASNVTKQMLEEIEINRLRKEKLNLAETYIPDEKTPIYDFMDIDRDYYHKRKEKFFNEEGIEVNMKLDYYDERVKVYGVEGTEMHPYFILQKDIRKIYDMLEYAKFIDSIIGSNLSQELKNEIGVYFEKASMSNIFISNEIMTSKLPIFTNLLKSYQNIKEKCKETKINFRSQEKVKRENFYRQNKFRNEIALLEDKSLKKEKNKEKIKKNKESKTTEDRDEKE